MLSRLPYIAIYAALLATSAFAEDLPKYKDTSLPFADRVADLVARLDLNEKAAQIQMAVPPNDRLGIPACQWWSEALHGVGRAGSATIYPQAIGMAATWNPALIKDVASAISDEARAKFDPSGSRYRGLMLWCPTVNMARDPRWGRVEETFGEDPYLSGRIGVAYVQGLQGDDPKYIKTVATPKHFAVHSQEIGRMTREVDVSEEIMRDYYFPAFQACFQEGKAMSVMAAHNGINGTPCTANKWLLTDVLRKEWGFEGAAVSDWTGVSQLMATHRYVQSESAAVAAALNAGLNVICDPRPLQGAVIAAVENKELSMETLDRALSQNLMVRFRLGMFDPPGKNPYARMAPTIGTREHIDLALKCAHEAAVLIKNDPAPKGYGFEQLLPIDLRRVDSIAVVGPYATVRQFGAYSAQAPAGPSPTIVDALRNMVGDRVQINTAEWGDTDRLVQVAKSSTIVIAVLGLNMQIEKEGIDRQSIDLPPDQKNFIERVFAANPLTIAVIEGGSPIGLEWMKEKVPAILNIWYPGEQGGNATADILLGKYNPAGRLPLTYYKTERDLPPADDYRVVNGRTYMYVTKPVSYPFGHGLSYTSFDYKSVKAPPKAAPDAAIDVSVDITNTGPRDGEEVAQLYVRKSDASKSATRPHLQLKAFQRVSIAKGQAKTVTFKLKISDLGLWDASQQKFVVEPGTYEMMIGASAGDIRVTAPVDIR
jgi:beta-glucosidase